MTDDRLFERTRPVRPRRRGAASTDPRRRPPGPRGRGRGRPARGASPPVSAQPRRRRRRVNWTRVTSAILCLVLIAGTAWLVAGPSLRVRAVTYTGAAWTQRSALDAVTGPIIGQSSLLIDGTAVADAVGDLPGVETATVDIGLFGHVELGLVEEVAVAVWRTDAVQLLIAEDGTVVGTQARDAALRGDYANLPFVDDGRDTSRDLSMGDQLPLDELMAALALADLEPVRIGSASSVLRLSLDPTYGFILSSPQAGWQAAFGYYPPDPLAVPSTIEARILAQASGMRTLFAEHPESGVAWIDARNPGRVYFRARG